MTARKLDWHGERLHITELVVSLMIDSGEWALDFSMALLRQAQKARQGELCHADAQAGRLAAGRDGGLLEFHQGGLDRARAIGPVEIIHAERLLLRKHRDPGRAEVSATAVVAQHHFRCGGGVGTFCVQHPRADAVRGMAVTVDKQHAVVRQAHGVKRVALETTVGPGEALATVGGTRDRQVIVVAGGAHEGDQVLLGRLVDRSFVELDLGIRRDHRGVAPGEALIVGNHQVIFRVARVRA